MKTSKPCIVNFERMRAHASHNIIIREVNDWNTNREKGIEIVCLDCRHKDDEPLLVWDNPKPTKSPKVSKKTPREKILEYVRANQKHKNIKEAQAHIRKHGTSDYMCIANVLYTMEEYDMAGQRVSFYNKRTDTRIEVLSENRYKYGFADAVVKQYDNYGAWRNDITYAD